MAVNKKRILDGSKPPAPLRSAHTSNFAPLLDQLGISLAVTTYQSGKLAILRADGDRLNTHFRDFDRPMGLAYQDGRLAIGTELEIWEFHKDRSGGAGSEPAGDHDALFLPRSSLTTGDIQIHEMEWSGDELWFVNTRFSCLCTRDRRFSFVPRWRPPFISALVPEDRCHLNGLAMVDGRPRFVTALSTGDTLDGWRQHKREGGVLLDVPSGEVVCRGLSMPHSPRVYGGHLWLLNSGAGSLGVVDPQNGMYREAVSLPGFTRGLDFYGRYAFIGLSQVRESAVFAGIAIADRPIEDRRCGIWVVDIVTGRTVAFVRFENALQEIFAVAVLPGLRFPDLINNDRQVIADSFVLPH